MTGTTMWLEMLLFALVALDLTGSPFLVSLVFFLRWMPMLFGFGLGIVADRINRKYMMIAGLVLQSGVSALLATLMINNSLRYWHLATLSLVIGLVAATEFPVRRAMMSEVVRKSQVGRAVSLEQAGNSVFRMLGPLAGGIFLETIGAHGGFLLGACLYAIGLIISLTLNYRPTKVATDLDSAKNALVTGVQYIRGSQVMIGVLVVTLILNGFGFSFISQQPIIARQQLMVSDFFIGVLQSVEGLGALLGAMTVALFARPKHYTHIFTSASCLYLVAILIYSLSNTYWLSLIIMFCGGIGMSCFATMQSTMLIYVSSAAMRARVLGAIGVFIALGLFTQPVIGITGSILSPSTAILLSASIGIVCMVLAMLFIPSLRNAGTIDEESTQI